MKSLPEKDFWNEIGNRLANYTEEPEDDWDKIAGAIPSSTSSAWMRYISEGVSVAALMVFLLLPFTESQNSDVVANLSPQTHDSLKQNTLHVNRSAEQIHDPAKQTRDHSMGEDRRTLDPDNDNGSVSMSSGDSGKKDPCNEPDKNVSKNDPGKEQLVGFSERSDTTPSGTSEEDKNSALTTVPGFDNTTGPIPEEKNVLTHAGTGIGTLPSSKVMADSLEMKKIKKDTLIPLRKETEKQKSKKKKELHPSVYFLATGSLAYQKMIPLKNDNVTIQKMNSFDIFSANRSGFSIETGFQLQISEHVELYTGLSYYRQQQTVSYSYVVPGNVQIQSRSPEPPSYTLTPGTAICEFDYDMQNAGVSLGFLYHIKGDKLLHKLGGGLQYQKGFLSSGEDESYQNSQSNYLNYQLLYRMEFILNKKLNFFLQPSFTRALVANEVLNEPFRMKPYRAGLGFGIVCRL